MKRLQESVSTPRHFTGLLESPVVFSGQLQEHFTKSTLLQVVVLQNVNPMREQAT